MRPDVAVLDIEMPVIGGLDAAVLLREELPNTGVLVLTGMAQLATSPALSTRTSTGTYERTRRPRSWPTRSAGVAKGQRFLDPALVEAALEIGLSPLTRHEVDVLRAAADGGSAEEIGASLYLSPATVRNYLSNAISKLSERNRTDAIRIARDAGWL